MDSSSILVKPVSRGGYVTAEAGRLPRALSLPGALRQDGAISVRRGVQLPNMPRSQGETTPPSRLMMPAEMKLLHDLKSVHSISSLTTASGTPSPRAEVDGFHGFADQRPPPLQLSENLGCTSWMPDQRLTPQGGGSSRRHRRSASKTRPDSSRSNSVTSSNRFYLQEKEECPLSPCSPYSPLSPLPSPSQLWLKRRKGSKSGVRLSPLSTNFPVVRSPRAEQRSQSKPLRECIKPLMENEKIFDRYYWEEVLQEDGDGGKVVVCRPKDEHITTPASFRYVMKIRSKATLRLQQPNFEENFRKAQEQLLNLPSHAGVMPLKEVLEDERFYYIVMDKANGGSFLGGLVEEFKDGVVPPHAIQKVMTEILEAVRHVHDQGLLHRDIKPDNLVTQVCEDGSKRVMLIDFDHADAAEKNRQSERYTEDVFGTLRFNAPETFAGSYSQQSDLYSVGVILYLLMTGKMPYDDTIFEEATISGICPATPKFSWKKAIMHRLREERIDWQSETWDFQPLCKDLCMKLLAFKTKDRVTTASEALSHVWFAEFAGAGG